MPTENQNHQQQKRIGLWMVIIMWLLVLGLLTMFFQSWYEEQFNPNQTVNGEVSEQGVREVVLQRNRYGHYVTSGVINSVPVVFMVDTGASDISIPAKIAEQIGLKAGRKVVYQTANGPAVSYATVLNQIAIGKIELNNVRASINPNVGIEEILLGMTFLKGLEFSQREDKLTLRQFP